uniref:Probable ATP-dependent transporter ycf16 n=1 Tax=Yamadaella caenomyce TaxID=259029 RepID=A0A1G4NZ46_9FLOR|nr:Iron-sulfur cluster formation ABC transporter ATP-binding subunit [Yamadaella caenomyce]SCW23789.1 Iron-sulfur cluster formation ABC transporter ATP-binding subunit [Yamadaella caenomyce]
MKQEMLVIDNLHVQTGDVKILNGLDLRVNSGEVHAIMGPNGSGKSTLAKVIAGHTAYTITQGSIKFQGQDITDLDPDLRAHLGIFLGFQYPVEVPGVTNTDFLRLAYNSRQKFRSLPELDPLSFFEFLSSRLNIIGMDSKFLNRNVNEGFSGGEKKKNEVLQMAVLQPFLSILDEMDSGLDIDALKTISYGINQLLEGQQSLVLITHYQRLLDYISPSFVHIMHEGKIKLTGDASLAYELEKKGYELLDTKL